MMQLLSEVQSILHVEIAASSLIIYLGSFTPFCYLLCLLLLFLYVLSSPRRISSLYIFSVILFL